MILDGNSELHRRKKIAGDGKYLGKFKTLFYLVLFVYLKDNSLFIKRIIPSWEVKKIRKIANIENLIISFILVTLLSAYHSLLGSTLLCPYLSIMDVANRSSSQSLSLSITFPKHYSIFTISHYSGKVHSL